MKQMRKHDAQVQADLVVCCSLRTGDGRLSSMTVLKNVHFPKKAVKLPEQLPDCMLVYPTKSIFPTAITRWY
jgi:hypothetical protein